MEPKLIEMKIPCNLKKVREVKSSLMDMLEDGDYDDEQLFNLQLVMDEAVINAIDHGSANNTNMNVEISMGLADDYLKVTVKDFGGKPFNPEFFERIASKKNWGRGGRGIFLIKDFMDEVRYVFNPGESTLLYMGKKLAKAGEIDHDDDDLSDDDIMANLANMR